jgi:hypothetical protein
MAAIAELAGQPSVLATDQSVPSFDIARIEGADAVIAGRAAPGAIVDLLRGDERLDRAVADVSGQFVMAPSHLPDGSYELTLNTRLPDGTVTSSKQGVKVTVNDVGASSRAAQSRAEYIPESSSQTRPPLQPHLWAAKPQERVALKSVHASPGGSASEEGVSSPAVAPRNLTKVISRGDSLWRISRITWRRYTMRDRVPGKPRPDPGSKSYSSRPNSIPSHETPLKRCHVARANERRESRSGRKWVGEKWTQVACSHL